MVTCQAYNTGNNLLIFNFYEHLQTTRFPFPTDHFEADMMTSVPPNNAETGREHFKSIRAFFSWPREQYKNVNHFPEQMGTLKESPYYHSIGSKRYWPHIYSTHIFSTCCIDLSYFFPKIKSKQLLPVFLRVKLPFCLQCDREMNNMWECWN